MVKLLSLITVLVTSLLTACNAVNVQPQPQPQPQSQSQSQSLAEQAGPAAATVTEEASDEQLGEFENLNSRITLLQEQFLELKVQNSSIAERVQLLLTQFQVLAQEVKRNSVSESVEQKPVDNRIAELVAQLDQQLLELQQVAPQLGGGHPFLLTTCYSAKGQWILIRYNRFSGESWISGDNSWLPLDEDSGLSISEYEIQLLRASNDVKGYVAARIDQNSGTTWWLDQNKLWVQYEQ